ncbi:MAG: hypothetical protein PWR17_646 [Candidatus Methanomethylophilaceae archaeon]|nr:hypothetical protein [Candidatus Methanomethylophilaceae archaeon]
MAGKKRIRMRGVKHASKRLEEELLDRSAELAADPGILRPMCAGNCRKCHFDKTFKDIGVIATHADNPDALLKDAARGSDDIVRAYAGTISLAAAGTAPLLATARLGEEKISYAVRGTVGADKLIGCQYYNDPKIRLLMYNTMVKKNRLYLYSFGENIVCSDKPNMPEDYLYDTFWETPYEFPDDALGCGHDALALLEIKIKSLGQSIRICSECAKDISTVQYIISRIAAIDPLGDIEVSVIHKYRKEGDDGRVKIEGDVLKKYAGGGITDKGLISSVMRTGMDSLKSGSTATYVVGKKNYGSDLGAFLSSLRGSDEDRDSLRLFLEKFPTPVVIRTERVNEALSAVWESNYKKIIELSTSKDTADSMGDVSKCVPADTLAEARKKFALADVMESLPVFQKPGPITKMCDKLAKSAKAGGAKMVLNFLDRSFAKDSKFRSISASFLAACDRSEKYPFKLSKDETEYMEYLVPFAKALIESDPSKYASSMNTMLTACSSGESV